MSYKKWIKKVENPKDINIRDTVDSNQINNRDLTSDEDKMRITSSDIISQNKKLQILKKNYKMF